MRLILPRDAAEAAAARTRARDSSNCVAWCVVVICVSAAMILFAATMVTMIKTFGA